MAPKFRYHLFDKVLVSDLQHGLLASFDSKGMDDFDEVRLRLSNQILKPQGESVLDDPNFNLQILFDGDRSLFILNPFSVVVVVSGDGLSMTLHSTDHLKPIDLQVQQAIDARIVTWVLSRIPILWGSPAIHGANLSFDEGSLMLLGQSGAGKSTLSQHLSKIFGATLHDDDTSSIKLANGPIIPVPMGAAARIRQDAAANLNLTGRLLPGYAEKKIALPRDSNPIPSRPPELRAIFEIVQQPPSNAVSLDASPHIGRLKNGESMLVTYSHLFQTNLSKAQREIGFSAAKHLAPIPTWRLTYVPGLHRPEEICRIIYKNFQGVSAK